MSWVPQREAALDRLQAFVPRAGRDYRNLRNYDLGPGNHHHVSGLSPYLRVRLLEETEVLAPVLERHGYGAAEKFVQEVCWRGYWKGWLEHHPGVWGDYQAELAEAWDRMAADDALQLRYDAAVSGTTGNDAVDGWSAELVETGYLHNHARMWFASLWSHTLDLPWVLGADFFLRHLLDGDIASNTLSWRWVVGLQTRGKTYLARPDNIDRYTRGRLSADTLRGLAPDAEPLDEPVSDTVPLELPLPAPRRPAPHGARSGLLILEEDVSLPDLDPAPVAIAGIAHTGTASGLDAADGVVAFRREAVAEAMRRASSRYAQAAVAPALWAGDREMLTAELMRWAREHDLDEVMVSYPTVGPGRDLMSALTAALAGKGIGVTERVSDYDRLLWPHARRGFFALKKKIPNVLQELGLQP